VIFFYERKYEYSASRLYPKEDLFAVHEIQEKPFYHYVAKGHHYGIPGIPNPLTQPFEEPVGCVFPVNEMTRHIDQYGIHADHFKIECPFFVPLHINEIIKNRQEY